VFVFGLVLGAARVRTRSLVTPIAMHAFFSGIALLQTAVRA
jgi:membrane protease YdiL (CAAX protease family)